MDFLYNKTVKVVLEKTSVNRIEQMQKVLCCYYLLNSDIDVRSKWIELSNDIKTRDKAIYKDAKTEGDNIVDGLSTFHAISAEEASLSKKVFSNTLSIIEKESSWEKKAYDYLDSKTKAHPIVSKLIIVLLSGILTGLIGNIVYDAVRDDGTSHIHQNTVFIRHNQQMKEVYVDKDGFIKIDDVSGFMIKIE